MAVDGFEDGAAAGGEELIAYCAAHGRGVGRAAGSLFADDLRAVGGDDDGAQVDVAVVHGGVSADGNLAAAAEGGEHGAFGGDGNSGCLVIEALAELERFARIVARFDSERALADGGAHDVGVEQFGDAVVPAETAEAGGSENDGVVLSFIELAEASVEIAADVLDLEIGAAGAELGGAPEGDRKSVV